MAKSDFRKQDDKSPATLTRLYILALAFVAALALVAQVIIQFALNHQLKDAYVVNMAGRQRMLSQKITKTCLLLQSADSSGRKNLLVPLARDLSNWERFHYYFLSGEEDLHYSGDENTDIRELYSRIHSPFRNISRSAHVILRNSYTNYSRELIAQEVKTILKNEDKFLRGMNSIVLRYEEISQKKVTRLKETETILLCLTVIVLAFEGWFVFRPAIRKIYRTINQLKEARAETENYNRQLIQAHQQLVAANDELENKINERTRDIELQKQELRLKNQQLEKLTKDLDTFVYSASHDLKAPINNLEGLINGLIQTTPEVNEKAPEFVNLIKHSLGNFKDLLGELSDTAKARKVAEGEVTNVRFDVVLDEIQSTLHEELVKYNGVIESDFSVVPSIRFSGKNLRSLLYNLISNGLKYRSALRNPVVKVRSLLEKGKVVLEVSDNGLGIPEQDIPRIFSMYQRLHDHVEGTGVGMSLVKKIIENEGAEIEVNSEIEVGTRIRVFFKQRLEN